MEFREIAHLYIGCQTTEGKLIAVTPWTAYVEINHELQSVPLEDLVPVLRHLDSLTEDEKKTIESLGSDPAIEFFYERGKCLKHTWWMKSKGILYLLKKGFDLFGLIESGEAVNKMGFDGF